VINPVDRAVILFWPRHCALPAAEYHLCSDGSVATISTSFTIQPSQQKTACMDSVQLRMAAVFICILEYS